MFIKKCLVMMLVSVICLVNLNISVAAEENDIIFSPNWTIGDGYKEETEEEQGILLLSTIVNISWEVGIKTEKKTKAFHKNAGSKIVIDVSAFPKKKMRVGIVAKDIGRMYVDTTDKVKKTFNIKKQENIVFLL